MDRLGVHYGYVWYRLMVNSPRARKKNLFLPDCADRATIYVNGKLAGVWGSGQDAVRKPIPAGLKRGQNVITVLADNMGRIKIGARFGELKGLYGHIYDAKPLKTRKFKLTEAESFNRRMVPRQLAHLLEELQKLPVYVAELSLPMTKVTPLHMSLDGLPYHASVSCNDRQIGFFQLRGENYGDIKLGPELRRGKNKITLTLWGDVKPAALDSVKFHMLNENVTEKAKWSWRPWEMPTGEGMLVGKDQPAWYTAKFKYSPADKPLFLRLLGAKKGQLFLNGRNVGRFWNVGPQFRYYLPECWLDAENELLVFEETGHIPSGSRLEFKPLGPFED